MVDKYPDRDTIADMEGVATQQDPVGSAEPVEQPENARLESGPFFPAGQSDLIEYTTVERMASAYQEGIARIRKATAELHEAQELIVKAFGDGYHFSLRYHHMSDNISISPECWRDIEREFHRAAWSAILAKTGIYKVMSSKRAQELREALGEYGGKRTYFRDSNGDAVLSDPRDPLNAFPPITPETITQVVKGYASSATEFLEEAVKQEYDYWKPSPYNCRERRKYKRNDEFVLGKRIIRSYMVTTGWGGKFRIQYGQPEEHCTALDNIFHMLDGKKGLEGYRGPFVDTVNASATGAGETDYFKFKCHLNGNLHLEFKRLDLLALFNRVAGRNRLPGKCETEAETERRGWGGQ
jgi:hypothetical protein